MPSGVTIQLDQDRTAFKQSTITIVFAGMYPEAPFFIVGAERKIAVTIATVVAGTFEVSG